MKIQKWSVKSLRWYTNEFLFGNRKIGAAIMAAPILVLYASICPLIVIPYGVLHEGTVFTVFRLDFPTQDLSDLRDPGNGEEDERAGQKDGELAGRDLGAGDPVRQLVGQVKRDAD